MTDWKAGDIANGHVLGDDGVWRPTLTEPAAPAVYWDNRRKAIKSNAWLLWLFLGGVGGHLIYLADVRKETKLALAGAAVFALIVTGGLIGLTWLFSWVFIGSWAEARFQREVEAARAAAAAVPGAASA